jgi:hypothetical protein
MRWPAALERWRLHVRLALFVLIGGYILLGPVPHQVFGAPHSSLLPRWRMFSGKSMQECAGYFERRDQGAPVRVDDWYTRIGLNPDRSTHRRQQRVTRVSEAEKLGERLCKKLGRGADVRLFLRCPSRTKGWIPKAQGEHNLCDPQAKAAARDDRAKERRNKAVRRQERRRREERPAARNTPGARVSPARPQRGGLPVRAPSRPVDVKAEERAP